MDSPRKGGLPMPNVEVWTGRAHRLLAPVVREIGRLHGAGEPCILLVPEQLTLQTERELLSRLKLPGFFTIEVLSPPAFPAGCSPPRARTSGSSFRRGPPHGREPRAGELRKGACFLPVLRRPPRLYGKTFRARGRHEARRACARCARRIRRNPAGGHAQSEACRSGGGFRRLRGDAGRTLRRQRGSASLRRLPAFRKRADGRAERVRLRL